MELCVFFCGFMVERHNYIRLNGNSCLTLNIAAAADAKCFAVKLSSRHQFTSRKRRRRQFDNRINFKLHMRENFRESQQGMKMTSKVIAGIKINLTQRRFKVNETLLFASYFFIFCNVCNYVITSSKRMLSLV